MCETEIIDYIHGEITYVYNERKEITQGEIGEGTVITTSNVYIYIYIYINKYKVCYHKMITRSKVHEQCI